MKKIFKKVSAFIRKFNFCERLHSLEELISDYCETIVDLKSDYKDLKETLDYVKSEMRDIRERVRDMKDEVDEIDNLRNDIDDLRDDVDDIEIPDLGDVDVEDLEFRVNEIEALISKMNEILGDEESLQENVKNVKNIIMHCYKSL